jgi:hypothetical protein
MNTLPYAVRGVKSLSPTTAGDREQRANCIQFRDRPSEHTAASLEYATNPMKPMAYQVGFALLEKRDLFISAKRRLLGRLRYVFCATQSVALIDVVDNERP